MPKSSSKKVKNTISNFNLFENIGLEDNCWINVEGEKVSGPGVICWVYIIFIIVINFYSLIHINEFKKMGLSNFQVAVRYFFQFLYMFLSMTFMYSMCKRCRGFEGLFILILLGFIASIIAVGPILSQSVQDLKKKIVLPKTSKSPRPSKTSKTSKTSKSPKSRKSPKSPKPSKTSKSNRSSKTTTTNTVEGFYCTRNN